MRVLVLCTGNSCRSQMAEAILRSMDEKIEDLEVFSAGIEKHGLNENAMKVLAEQGYKIDKLYSKTVDELPDVMFDVVLTVCSHAHQNCPLFTKTKKTIHQGFDDPPALAKNLKDEEEVLGVYRRVRDQIEDYIKNEFVLTLKNG